MEYKIQEVLQTALLQKKEPLLLELIKQKIGKDESELALALADDKVYQADIDRLKGALKYCMVIVGLRSQNWPVEEEKAVLIDFILKEYGGHTLEEIKLAFRMAVAGKLEFGEKESVNCYENFSVVYFASVMRAYRRWSSQSIKSLPVVNDDLPQIPIWQIEIEYCYAKLKDLKSILKKPLVCTIG